MIKEDKTCSRILKEVISDIPEQISDTEIEFTKIEKWSVTKQNLLDQKISIENQMLEYQKALNEIDLLLAMFEV